MSCDVFPMHRRKISTQFSWNKNLEHYGMLVRAYEYHMAFILANSVMRTMMWWSAWTCSSSIKSNIQCQIGFKFKYSNIRERTWQHLKRNKCPFILIVFDSVRIFMCSSSPNTVCAPLTSCDASKNPFLRWHFLRYDTFSPPHRKWLLFGSMKIASWVHIRRILIEQLTC